MNAYFALFIVVVYIALQCSYYCVVNAKNSKELRYSIAAFAASSLALCYCFFSAI